MGSETNPATAGDNRNPHAHIPILKLIPLVSNTSCPRAVSETIAFDIPAIPLLAPRRNLHSNASPNDVDNPNNTEKTELAHNDRNNTILRPYVSPILPQSNDVTARPIINVAANNPAYGPAFSVSVFDTKEMTIYPLYGKTLTNNHECVNVHKHIAAVDR